MYITYIIYQIIYICIFVINCFKIFKNNFSYSIFINIAYLKLGFN